MFYVFIEFYFFVERIVDSVDAHAHVTRFFEIFKLFPVFALSAPHNGSHYNYFVVSAFSGGFDYSVRNLVHRLMLDFPAAFRTVRGAYARVKQSQIVVYFGYRSHGGTRVFRGCFLVD